MIFNIGREANAVFRGNECNSYLICGQKNILINTVPEKFAEQYIEALGKYILPEKVDVIILQSSAPEHSGVVRTLIGINPGIQVYATVAGLKLLGEILNCDFNGNICKNGAEIIIGDEMFTVAITPNLTWPDTMMIKRHKDGAVFSGLLFSTLNETDSEHVLNGCRDYVSFALESFEKLNPGTVYPVFGNPVIYGERAFEQMRCKSDVLIVYASETGYNQKIAEIAETELKNLGLSVLTVSAAEADTKLLAGVKGLVLGTYTYNRTMPREMWDFVSKIDVNAVKGKPYFVYTSYGWSCEGGFTANELLSMLKMRRVAKMCECVLNPSDENAEDIKKACGQMAEFMLKAKEAEIYA